MTAAVDVPVQGGFPSNFLSSVSYFQLCWFSFLKSGLIKGVINFNIFVRLIADLKYAARNFPFNCLYVVLIERFN